MATELIIESYWSLKNFWTKIRVPLPNKSDFDVIAYNPNKKHLVVAESKAQNIKNMVYVYSKLKENESFVDSYWKKFLCNIPYLWNNDEWDAEKLVFDNFEDSVNKLTIHHVSNTYIEKNCVEKAENDIKTFIINNGFPFHWDSRDENQIINFLNLHSEMPKIDFVEVHHCEYSENAIEIHMKGKNGEVFSLVKKKVKNKTKIQFNKKKADKKKNFSFDANTKLVYKCPLFQNLRNKKIVDNLDIIIDNHLELFFRIQETLISDNQGRRFGNPILDIQRELNRYFNPIFDGLGKNKKYNEDFIENYNDYINEKFVRMTSLFKAGLK